MLKTPLAIQGNKIKPKKHIGYVHVSKCVASNSDIWSKNLIDTAKCSFNLCTNYPITVQLSGAMN